jgi:hypothetical protein
MRARVATFVGEVRGAEYDEQIEQIRSEVKSGNRPPGLEDAKGVLILSGEGASASPSPSSTTRRACAAATLRSTR